MTKRPPVRVDLAEYPPLRSAAGLRLLRELEAVTQRAAAILDGHTSLAHVALDPTAAAAMDATIRELSEAMSRYCLWIQLSATHFKKTAAAALRAQPGDVITLRL